MEIRLHPNITAINCQYDGYIWECGSRCHVVECSHSYEDRTSNTRGDNENLLTNSAPWIELHR